MTTNEAWLGREKAVKSGVLSHYFDIVADSGEGSWITDVEGNRYLDFASGIAVTSIGHCHPAVTAAITAQAQKLVHTSIVTHNQPNVVLAEKITASVPYIKDAQIFFCNTGAEAVDGSLKLARKVTHKPGIIAFRRAFHGRTLAATSITTASGRYRADYEPFLPSVHIAPYCLDGDVDSALAQLDEILSLQAPADNVGCMIVEPFLGEGGYVLPPAEWLQGLRQRCTQHGMLLIFDEVQSGIGRTGSMFAAEALGIIPDVILFAKGIANGMPLGGIIASKELMDQWPVGTHGTTFGGNPLSCAAGIATLEVIESENLMQHAREAGARALEAFRAVDAPKVKRVHGLGLMIGIELIDEATTNAVQKACFDEGLLFLVCGADHNVIRLIPALNIKDEDLDRGVEILSKALASV